MLFTEPYLAPLALLLAMFIVIKISQYALGHDAKVKREFLASKGYSRSSVWVTVITGIVFITACPILGVIAFNALLEIALSGMTGDQFKYPNTGASVSALVVMTVAIWLGMKGAQRRITTYRGVYFVLIGILFPIEVIASAASIVIVSVVAILAILASILLRSKQV